MSTTETPITALATIEKLTAPQLFAAGALDPIIDSIEREVRAVKTDISTPEGRKQIAALAYKVARSKTFVDEKGKALVADKKEEVKAVDRERARVWNRLESLQKEVRKPLTDWEDKEKERIAGHEATIRDLLTMIDRCTNQPISDIESALDYVNAFDPSTMAEFAQRAMDARRTALEQVSAYLARRRQEEADAAELARLRQEAAERAQKDREEQIAREAREQAERAAREREEAAQRQADEERERAHREQLRIESERKLAEERAQRAEQDRIAFEERARKEMLDAAQRAQEAADAAEQDRIDAANKAECDRVAAAKQAEADKKAAVEAERKRVADIKKKEAEEEKARKKDKEHKAAIHNDILAALSPEHITPDDAKLVIRLIAQGKVPHITINY